MCAKTKKVVNENAIPQVQKTSLLFDDSMVKIAKRTVSLGFVKLENDVIPKTDVKYSVVSAGDEYLYTRPYPQNTQFKKIDIDLYELYIDNLPDFTHKNEGLLKISINTLKPQDLNSTEVEATLATDFKVKDETHASSFLYRGLYRNVIIENWVNIRFNMYEIDTDTEEYYKKVKQVVVGVPELKNLDILKGIPYLNVATQLFESIIKVFGKNPDDHIWGEMPILEFSPTPGGAFLRSGIYIIYERFNKVDDEFSVNDFVYVNGRIQLSEGNNKVKMPNHLIFGIKIEPKIG